MSSPFPSDFVWGAATSAHQIEGSPRADGAGMTNWVRFEKTKGRIRNGDRADVATDHYHRWAEDVGLMRELGLGGYRFSIAWARVQPDGRGPTNVRGLAFYDRLVDSLLENGIQPFPTLHHWDLPAALEDRGAWTNPDIVERFTDYAGVVFEALGDRVHRWSTLNEPWVMVDAGYVHGVHPPGRRCLSAATRAALHMMRAHVAAVRRYRQDEKGEIGIVVNLEPKVAATESVADREATRRADAYMNRQFLDPLLLGRIPEELATVYGPGWAEFGEAWHDLPVEPIDFLGINYYTRAVTADAPNDYPEAARRVPQTKALRTDMGWEVHAPSFGQLLRDVHARYGPMPLYVTENGSAFTDPPQPIDGRVDDPLRRAYLRDHLREAADAIADGVDLRGYFAWSLLDNFEWGEGFTRRLGIVHVDYESLERTIKASGRYYQRVVASAGDALFDESSD